MLLRELGYARRSFLRSAEIIHLLGLSFCAHPGKVRPSFSEILSAMESQPRSYFFRRLKKQVLYPGSRNFSSFNLSSSTLRQPACYGKNGLPRVLRFTFKFLFTGFRLYCWGESFFGTAGKLRGYNIGNSNLSIKFKTWVITR